MTTPGPTQPGPKKASPKPVRKPTGGPGSGKPGSNPSKNTPPPTTKSPRPRKFTKPNMPKFKKPNVSYRGIAGWLKKYRMWLYAISAILAVIAAIMVTINYPYGKFFVLGVFITLLIAVVWYRRDPKGRKAKIKGWMVTLLGNAIKLGFAAAAGLAFWTYFLLTRNSSGSVVFLGLAIGFALAAFRVIDFSKDSSLKRRIEGLLLAVFVVALAHYGAGLLKEFVGPNEAPPFVHFQHQAEVDANRDGTESYTELVKIENDCHVAKGIEPPHPRPTVKVEVKDNKCFVYIRINDGSARIHVGKETHAINHQTSPDGIWTVIEVVTPNKVDMTVFRYVYKPGLRDAPRIPQEFLKQKALYVHPTYVQG